MHSPVEYVSFMRSAAVTEFSTRHSIVVSMRSLYMVYVQRTTSYLIHRRCTSRLRATCISIVLSAIEYTKLYRIITRIHRMCLAHKEQAYRTFVAYAALVNATANTIATNLYYFL